MTGRTIKSHDPDLDQTFLDMSNAVHRLSIAEASLVEAHRQDEEEGAKGRVPHAVAVASAIRDAISARAKRLHLPPAAVRVIISQHDRLQRRMGRRPNMEQLVAAVEAAEQGFHERAQSDHAAYIEARFHAKRSRQYAEDSTAASAYLRTCA